MQKITSFTIDHTKLKEGIYVSRIDGDITTYDLRTKAPNSGVYMDNVTMHTLEHMLATYLRNSKIKDKVIYFGPMGCQTGFYLLIRNADNLETLEVLKDCLKKTVAHKGEVFGCSEIECGNYKTLELSAATKEAKNILKILDNVSKFSY